MRSGTDTHDFDPSTHLFTGCPNIEANDLLIIQTTFREFLADKVQWMGIEFQVWLWSQPKLLGIYLGMANKLGIVNCGESLERLLELAFDIINLYINNPYHYYGHAFDVAFMVYYMLEDLGVAYQMSLTKSELVALFVGALGHDMGHPGLNNIYQINSHTELAHKYNNKSILENYAIDLLYGLLDKNPYLNIVTSNDAESMDHIRNLIKHIILNTDMIYHFDIVAKLLALLEIQPTADIQNEESENKSVDSGNILVSFDSIQSQRSSSTVGPSSALERMIYGNLDSRNILISSILHAADISNPARPFLVSKIWSDKVMEEFFLQGDKEKANSLPISPSMDRDVTNEGDVATGFTNFIVQPFFDLLSVIFPRMDCFSLLLRNNAQRREVDSVPSPFQPMKEELAGETQSTLKVAVPKLKNTARKVSMAAGMIEIKDDLISSMSGRILYKRRHADESTTSRRTTQSVSGIIEE